MTIEKPRPRSASDSDLDGGRATPDDVMFLNDLARLLRVSRVTIERRRREGTFPIPELDRIDRRPRWSRQSIQTYLATGSREMRRPRGRPRIRRMVG